MSIQLRIDEGKLVMANEAELDHLAERAEHVHSLLSFASRPFVLEFAGSPKAGKSTSVDAIAHLFRRHKFHTHVLRERASFCPIPMKGHLFFNMWCACTMLAEVLENMDTDCDIILKDRGIFDTLIWLERQIRHGEVTDEEARRLRQFLLMDRWTRMVDLVLVVTVSPSVAIERELKPRLSQIPGSIMNERALTSINEALVHAVKEYQPCFSEIKVYDTTDSTPRDTNIKIGNYILDRIERFLHPDILVLNEDTVKTHFFRGDSSSCFSNQSPERLFDLIEDKARFVKRSDAEQADNLVQVIACGLLTYSDRIFLFKREDKDPKAKLYGKSTIWQGGHVSRGEASIEELIKDTVFAKLKERLFLSRSFNANFLGYAWDEANPESRKHLGLLYELEIDSEDVANDLQAKAFKSGRGYGLFGQFLTPRELSDKGGELQLERWSAEAIKARLGGAGEQRP
jgi:predicted NUDIX family phosphoesterase